MAVSGSSDYSMWLGQSERKIMARFAAIRAIALAEGVPVVMFWDEIDAIGRRRGTSFGGDAPDRILNTFLAELDGIAQLQNVIVIAATNRIDILDPGLTRAGRLGDEIISIPPPSRAGAKAIWTRYLRDLPLRDSIESLIEPLLSRVYGVNGEYAGADPRDPPRRPEARPGWPGPGQRALLENSVRKAAEAAAIRAVETAPTGSASMTWPRRSTRRCAMPAASSRQRMSAVMFPACPRTSIRSPWSPSRLPSLGLYVRGA